MEKIYLSSVPVVFSSSGYVIFIVHKVKRKKSELKQGAKGSRGLRVCNQPQTRVAYNWKYHKLFWLARRIVYIHTHGYTNRDFWIIASLFQRVNYKSNNAICLDKTSCPGIWKPAGAGGVQSLRGRFQISEFLSARKIHNPGKERPKGLENMHGIINVSEQANRILAFFLVVFQQQSSTLQQEFTTIYQCDKGIKEQISWAFSLPPSFSTVKRMKTSKSYTES